MVFQLGNLWMLFGLIALAIPIVLHLLQRRRFDVLDWGAMQFLPDSIAAQKKRWIDEILLMLLRMALIAMLVIALATPFSTSAWLAPLGERGTRDVVLIFDGSYSMDQRVPGQPTPWDESVRWAHAHLDQASRGDRFAILIARQPPLYFQEDFSGDLADVRAKLDEMPIPHGNPDMPLALAEAWRHLQAHSKAAAKELIVLTDRQHHGWANLETLAVFDHLGSQWHADMDRAKSDGWAIPSLRVIQVGEALAPGLAPNFSLAPLASARSVVKIGQTITLRSALHLDGFEKSVRPGRVKVSVDGRFVQNLALPANLELKQGQIPLVFQHRFDKEGIHVVSLGLECDPSHDVLAADNAQHAAIEVVKELPILLVDGDRSLSPESGSFFLQRALATGKKPPAAIAYHELKPAMIVPENGRPAVVVLADVPRLDTAQRDALERFVAAGGGLLVVLGERAAKERSFYNDQLYGDGQSWLPVKLGEIGSAKDGVQPEPRTFQHAALELFRAADGTLGTVRFTNWCKVDLLPRDRATAIGLLSNGEPFLIERPYKQGRVMVSTVPLDRRWGSTLPNSWEFPILVHELAYYLAGGRNESAILQHGAPIRLPGRETNKIEWQTPEMAKTSMVVNSWPWVYANTGAIGVYAANLQVRPSPPASGPEGPGRKCWIVRPDLREANLARCTDDDWRKVKDRLPIPWHTEAASVAHVETHRQELWWLLLAGVLGLLCTEVWMTRRMVLARGR